mmetsp:Transcript_33025/g.77203  ORF Transcript_33025/g.77203 Transcript_33025/m.77203 type:complete len:319 (-) Transcript_33025:134-1090(-)
MQQAEEDAAVQPAAEGGRPRGGASRWRQNADATRHDSDLALLRQTAVATAKRKAIAADEAEPVAENAILPPPAPEDDEPLKVAPPPAARTLEDARQSEGGAKQQDHKAAEAAQRDNVNGNGKHRSDEESGKHAGGEEVSEEQIKPPPTMDELIAELERHGPCTVFDVTIPRESSSQPLGMDVKHARHKLIVKTIYEESVIHQLSLQNSDQVLLVGDVILSVNNVETDTNNMVSACRQTSPLGDASICFKVLRFTNVHQRPYAKQAYIQKQTSQEYGGTSGARDEDDYDSIGADRQNSQTPSTCKVIARCVCRPLRTKV